MIGAMIFHIPFAVLLLQSFLVTCFSDGEECDSYYYDINTRIVLSNSTPTTLKAEMSFQRILKSNELQFTVYWAEFAFGSDRKNLSDQFSLNNWFSVTLGEHGEIENVFYPDKEKPEVIFLKKTLASYISGKFIFGDKNESYQVSEITTDGLKSVNYKRHVKDDSLTFEKSHTDKENVLTNRQLIKTVVFHHQTKAPHSIEFRDDFKIMHNSSKQIEDQFHKAPNRPHANFSINSNEVNFPHLQIKSSGSAKLMKIQTDICSVSARPNRMKKDNLTASAEKISSHFNNFDHQEKKILGKLEQNIAFVRSDLNKKAAQHQNAFEEIVRILKEIPGERLEFVSLIFLNKSKLIDPVAHKNRLIVIDALSSLFSENAQMILYKYELNGSNLASADIVHRIFSNLMGLDKPPIHPIINRLEELALHHYRQGLASQDEDNEEKDYERSLVLIYGAYVDILMREGDPTEVSRAQIMMNNMKKLVGFHDPYHWKVMRQKRSPVVCNHLERQHARALVALGNTGQHGDVFHLIVSHLNHSDTPYKLKMAALMALKSSSHEDTAQVLLELALYGEESNLRYEALKLYQDHPRAANFYQIYEDLKQGYRKGIYPKCPKELDNAPSTSLQHSERVKRSAMEFLNKRRFHLKLEAASVDWVRRYGGQKAYADIGLKMKNQFLIDIKIQKSIVKLEIDNQAYFKAAVLGYSKSLLDAKFCLVAAIQYDLNTFDEYGIAEILELAELWDKSISGLVFKIRNAIQMFKQFFSAGKNVFKLLQNLNVAIEDLPRKVRQLRHIAYDAAERIGELDEKQIPMYARPLIKSIRRAIQLYIDIKTDVMDFYNTIVDHISITLPLSWKQFKKGFQAIGSSIDKLFENPSQALVHFMKAMFKIKSSYDNIMLAKKEIEELLYKEKPYWFDLTSQLTEIGNEFVEGLKVLTKKRTIVKTMTKEELKLEKEFTLMLRNIVKNLTGPIEDLRTLVLPFIAQTKQIFSVIRLIKEIYVDIRYVINEGRSIIERLFGPKAYHEFPRKLRVSGAGCSSDGTYPTQNGYSDSGIDLLADPQSELKLPFDGIVSKLDTNNTILIKVNEGSLDGLLIKITNVKPLIQIPDLEFGVQMSRGSAVGHVINTRCQNHIHVSISQNGEVIDPTRYLQVSKLKKPLWDLQCGEFYLHFLERIILSGSLFKNEDKLDTSPGRTTEEPANEDLPETENIMESQQKKDDEEFSNIKNRIKEKSFKEKAKKAIQKVMKLPKSLDFSGILEKMKIRNWKLGDLVGFLDYLEMNKSKSELVDLMDILINFNKSPRCNRPEQLTNEQLRIAIREKGKNPKFCRKEMLKQYYSITSECPLSRVALPLKSVCKFDKNCISLECCLDYKIGPFYKAVKASASLDPCSWNLTLKFNLYPLEWEKEISIMDSAAGIQREIMTGVKLNFIGDVYEIKVRFKVHREVDKMLLDFDAALCINNETCLPYIHLFRNFLLPLPVCRQNGTIGWPKIDLKMFYNRTNFQQYYRKQLSSLRDSGDEQAKYVISRRLGLSIQMIDYMKNGCIKPAKMTLKQLRHHLGLSSTSNTKKQVLLRRVSRDMRRCRWFTIPQFPASVKDHLFCNISHNCLALSCCIEVTVPPVIGTKNLTFSLSTFVKFDPCSFTLTYGVQQVRVTKLILDYQWGEEREWQLGAIKIRYVIGKNDQSKEFVLKFGLAVCPLNDTKECILDTWVMKNHRIPIPLCNKNFTNCFKDNAPLKELLKKGLKVITMEAKNTILRCLKLDKYLSDRKDSNGTRKLQFCSLSIQPRVSRICTATAGSSCWKMECNMKLFGIWIPMKLSFNPCTYDLLVEMSLFKYSTNIMKNVEGSIQDIYLGESVKISYGYIYSQRDHKIRLTLGYCVCLNRECNPIEYILKNRTVESPLCNSNFSALLPGGSVPNFINWLAWNNSKSLSTLAIDTLLNVMGIKKCFSNKQCSVSPGDSEMVVNGWVNECPHSLQLKSLPTMVQCTLHSDCLTTMCCIDFDIEKWRTSLSFRMTVDPCSLKFNFSFEECNFGAFDIKWGKKTFKIELYKNFSFGYKFELDKYRPSYYRFTAGFEKCNQQGCTGYSIFNRTVFPHRCPREKVHKRVKRSAIKPNVQEVIHIEDSVTDLITIIENAIKDGGVNDLTYFDANMKLEQLLTEKLEKKAQKRPVGMDFDKRSGRIRKSIPFIPKPYHSNVTVRFSREAPFHIDRGVNFKIDESITKAGIQLLGQKRANMTIGELEAALDWTNLDPVRAHDLIVKLRNLTISVVEETIDVLFNGTDGDSPLHSFDIKLSASYEIPKRHITFIKWNLEIPLVLIPCSLELGIGLDGFYGASFQGSLGLLSLKAHGVAKPFIGVQVSGYGELSCFIFRARLTITGTLLQTHLPVTAEVGFSKFPLEVGVNVDLIIHASKYEVLLRVDMKVLFFMRRKRWFISTIFSLLFKWKVLYRKVLWSDQETSSRDHPIQKKPQKLTPAPPTFLSQPPQKRKKNELTLCSVTQLEGRSYDYPGLLIRSDPVDPYSKVVMEVSVGSSTGADDYVKRQKFVGPTTVFENLTAKSGPIHVLITARNSEGRVARAFCSLEVFDVTPPEIEVTTSFITTTDGSTLSGWATVRDDSEVTQIMAGVGLGNHLILDSILSFKNVSVKPRIVADNQFKEFDVLIKHENLSLLHNQLYFIMIFAKNERNYVSQNSARPVLVDLTTPDPPPTLLISSENLVEQPCTELVLTKWIHFCQSGSRKSSQHRIIIDSPGSKALFNGHKPMTETFLSDNNHFLSANFQPFLDNETDILGYKLCFGSRVCECDLVDWFDPHESTSHKHHWNYQGFVSKPHHAIFPDGTYFATLSALNRPQYGPPLVTTVCHHQGQILDTTPPVIHTITAIRYNTIDNEISFDISTSEIHSNLKFIQVSAGATKNDMSIAGLNTVKIFEEKPHRFTGRITAPLLVEQGKAFYLHIIVYNELDSGEKFTSPRPIFVDTTAPVGGIVQVGTSVTLHRSAFYRVEDLCFSWKNFHDPESGILSYDVIIETCDSGCSEVARYLNLPEHQHSVCASSTDNIQLIHNQGYYARVIASNAGHMRLSVGVQSEELLCDLSPALPGDVFDRNPDKSGDQNYTSSYSFYSVGWSPGQDPETDIEELRVSIHRHKHDDNKFKKTSYILSNDSDVESDLMRDRLPQSDKNHFEIQGLSLSTGDRLLASIDFVNKAGASSIRTTDGILVDLTPPVIKFAQQGLDISKPVFYQGDPSGLNISLRVMDKESGIAKIYYRVYEEIEGRKIKIDLDREEIFPPGIFDTNLHFYSINALSLHSGHFYTVRIKVINQAGVSAIQTTNAVVVDLTPPVIESVSVKYVEKHGMKLLLMDPTQLEMQVVAYDPESNMDSYWLAVGDSRGTDNVKQWTQIQFGYPLVLTNLTLPSINMNRISEDISNEPFLFYVSVKVVNQAGLISTESKSSQAYILLEHPQHLTKEPHVLDGPHKHDRDIQIDTGHVTATFEGIKSWTEPSNRIAYCVGSAPGLDDVIPLTSRGVHFTETGIDSGFIHIPSNLRVNGTYFVTVESLSGYKQVISIKSDGFSVVDPEPKIESFNFQTNEVNYRSASSKSIFLEWTNSNHKRKLSSAQLSMSIHPLDPGKLISNTTLRRFRFQHQQYSLKSPGLPIYLRGSLEDELGIIGRKDLGIFVLDVTPPRVVPPQCSVIHAQNAELTLVCYLEEIADYESPVSAIILEVVDGLSPNSLIFHSQNVPVNKRKTSLSLVSSKSPLFVRLNVKNAAGEMTAAYSSPIDTHQKEPPKPGIVIELGNFAFVNLTSPEHLLPDISTVCNDPSDCLRLDRSCMEIADSIFIAWSPFGSSEDEIAHYEVCLGTFSHGCDIVDWINVSTTRTHQFKGDRLKFIFRRIFATVRGYTHQGDFSTASSNGISPSYFLSEMEPPEAIGIKLGHPPHTNYHNDPLFLPIHWDFSAEPCPVSHYEWSIVRADGLILQNFTRVDKDTKSAVLLGLDGKMDDSYFGIVRVTNDLNLSYTFRSDPVTIKIETILPGEVFDGEIVGMDFDLQESLSSLSFSWKGFEIPVSKINYDANPSLQNQDNPQIDFYEVAIGMERSTATGRTNIVPFMNVRLNSSFVVSGLNLDHGAIYYVTVRANSRWFKSVESTSDGIEAGVISDIRGSGLQHDRYSSKSDRMTIKWPEFQTNLKIQTYFIGIRITDQSTQSCRNILSTGVDSDEMDRYFNVYALRAVLNSDEKKEVAFSAADLYLNHAQNYTIHVMGLDSAASCVISSSWFVTDFTPPHTPHIEPVAASFHDIFMTRERNHVGTVMKNVMDDESPIQKITLQMYQRTSCRESRTGLHDVFMTTGELATFSLKPNTRSFTIEGLKLQKDAVYYLNLTVTNAVGLSRWTLSSGLLVEEAVSLYSEPTIHIKIKDVEHLFININSTISYSFMHEISLNAKKKEDISFSNDNWKPVTSSGFVNLDYPWSILRSSEMIQMTYFNSSQIDLTLKRLVDKPGILVAALHRPIDISRGRQIEFQARVSPAQEVTTELLIWDGPSDAVTSLNHKLANDLQDSHETECECCSLIAINKTIECNCSCIKTTDNPPTTARLSGPGTDNWNVLDLEKIYPSDQKPYNVCGVQIFNQEVKDRRLWKIRLWCRFTLFNEVKQKFDDSDLNFDPSSSFHQYRLSINRDLINSFSVSLSVDDTEVLEMSTYSQIFHTKANLVFHILSKADNLPDIGNPWSPFTTSSSIRNMTLSRVHLGQFHYIDESFYWNASTPISYYSRLVVLGDNHTETPLTAWEQIATPCVPCLRECDQHFCNSSCGSLFPQVYEREIDVRNLSQLIQSLANTSEQTFFIHVKGVTVGGYSVDSQSAPVLLDTTMPEIDKRMGIVYYDVESEFPMKPAISQGSADTLKIGISVFDPDSGMKKCQIAVGSAPRLWDVISPVTIDCVSVVMFRNLSLANNHSYFTSVNGINNAGLDITFIDDKGVKVFSEPPEVDTVVADIPDSIPAPVPSDDTVFTRHAHDVTIQWTQPDDPAITKGIYSAGSRRDIDDDVVNKIVFDTTKPGFNSFSVKNGKILLNENSYDVTSTYMEKPTNQRHSGVNLEPGKHVYHHVKLCNSALKCSPVASKKVMIYPDTAQLVSTKTHQYSLISEDQHQTRQKRQVDQFKLSIKLDENESSNINVITSFISSPDIYSSDGVPNYSSYIVDPITALLFTSRLLRFRIVSLIGQTFFVAPVSQENSLTHQLYIQASMTLSPPPNQIYALIYWNTNSSNWRLAYRSCPGALIPNLDKDLNLVTPVCRTQESYESQDGKFFKYETQFAIAIIHREIINRAPRLEFIPSLRIFNSEDNQLASLTLLATDDEEDPILWSLDEPFPRLGLATLNKTTGDLTYLVHEDVHGMDTIEILVSDSPTLDGISQAQSRYSLPVHISTNKPVLLFGQPVQSNYTILQASEQDITNRETEISVTGLSSKQSDCHEPQMIDIIGVISNHSPNQSIWIETNVSATHYSLELQSNLTNLTRELTDYPLDRYTMKILRYILHPEPDFEGTQTFSAIVKTGDGKYTKPNHLKINFKMKDCPRSVFARISEVAIFGIVVFILIAIVAVVGIVSRVKKRRSRYSTFSPVRTTKKPENYEMEEL